MTAGSIAVPTIIPLRVPKPGKSKFQIDTNTKIELLCETAGTTIYYTYDGTKPDPFQRHGERTTMKYTQPFTVPEGKRLLKAVAVASDGLRESAVNTKTLLVEYIDAFRETMDDENSFQRELNRSKSHGTSTVRPRPDKSARIPGSEKRRPVTGPRFMNTRLSTSLEDLTAGTERGPRLTPKRAPLENMAQTLRMQRETDFLKCVYCFAPRPLDPYARFCNECGSPVPPLPSGGRLPPPEPGQMGMCVSCKSVVPMNTRTCVVCETPIPPQNQVQASIKLKDRIVCGCCGTSNPPNLTYCVMCESRLSFTAMPIFSGTSAPPAPSGDGRLVTCSKCSRVNNNDARFCDWCGAKPTQPTSHLKCSKCTANNQPFARFCGSCGTLLEPPTRSDPRNSGLTISGVPVNQSLTVDPRSSASWTPVSIPLNKLVSKKTEATQTVGLFYPSNRGMEVTQYMTELKKASMEKTNDRKPPISSVSPGRGYWRQQVEHICAHLKSYAQNHPEFRAMVGEPRIGKMLSGTIHEDGHELSLTLNFPIRQSQDPLKGRILNVTKPTGKFLSAFTEGRSISSDVDSDESDGDDIESVIDTHPKKSQKKKKKPVKKVDKEKDHPPVSDRLLLKEVSERGFGKPETIKQLIDEGADVECSDKDGNSVLTLAIHNNHIDSIPVLVNSGADIHRKTGPKGNTPLHAAVLLGPNGQEAIQTLLNCRANPRLRNDKGQTPYDLATEAGYESIVTVFASSMGSDMLNKMTKPKKRSPSVDVF